MVASESVEVFTDRFQRIRRAAKWDDDIRTATIFKRALPQDTVNKIAAKARMIMPSNVCQNDPSTSRSVPSPSVTASNRPSIGTRILSQGTDASKHNPKNAQRGMNLGASKSSTSGTTKNKSQCAVHGLANHPMEKCKIYKYFLANHAQPSGTFTAPVAIPSGSGTVSSNICFRYTGNIPWSREHAAVCPRDKSNFRPARAIRSACLVSASSSVPAPTRVTTSTADVNQLPGSNSMMDIDDNGFPVDYN
ncbi:hypothetical protein CU097_004348, partial [Rhizopus azygosporus]